MNRENLTFSQAIGLKKKKKREVLSSSSSSSECKVDRMRRSRDSRGRWWARWVHSCFVERKLTCCIPLGGIQFFRQTKESCLRSLSNKICLNHSAKKKINNKMIVLTRNSNELMCLSELFCAGIWQIVHRNLSTGEHNFITISANSSFFLFFYCQLSQSATARGSQYVWHKVSLEAVGSQSLPVFILYTFLCVLNGSLRKSHCAFVATERKLTGDVTLGQIGNISDWNLARWRF